MLHAHSAHRAITVDLAQISIRDIIRTIIALLLGRYRPDNYAFRISIRSPHFGTTDALTPAITWSAIPIQPQAIDIIEGPNFVWRPHRPHEAPR